MNNKRFIHAVEFILANEGGFNPSDPGGGSNFGITGKLLKDEGFADDVKTLARARAVEIYQQCWWDRYRYERIKDDIIIAKIFDLSVNIGPGQAHRIAQLAVNNCVGITLISNIDGILGPESANAINAQLPKGYLPCLIFFAKKYYVSLNRTDEKGLLARADRLPVAQEGT